MTNRPALARLCLWRASPSVLIVALVHLPAAAQDGTAILMDEIMVEGELQTRSLQDSQTSVAVITGEELERRDDFDLYDVIERTPNVTSSLGEKGFAIRGVDQRGVGGGGAGLLVTTVVDGATLSNNRQTFFGPYSTWDLGQIEVLRGPQSTQQGRNALAGAIVIRSADPTYDFELKGRGDIAERDTFGGAVAFNAPIIDNTLAVRFSAEHLQTDGFVDNPTLGTDDYDSREQTTLRGKVLFEPTDDFSAVLSASYVKNMGGEDLIVDELFPEERINPSDTEAEEGAEFGLFNLRMTYDFDDRFSLRSETSGLISDYVRIEDSDFSAAPLGFLDRDAQTNSIEQQLTLSYVDDRVSAVIGGYVIDVTENSDSGLVVPGNLVDPTAPADGVLNRVIASEISTVNFAFFGEAEVEVPELIEGFSVIVGGRYDREAVDFSDTTIVDVNFETSFPLPPVDTETSDAVFSAFLPKVGLVYDWTDDLSTGFTVQRGYRAGGTQRNALTGVINEFDPEFTWNFELALRSEWLGGRLTANANAFYTRWTDQQVNVLGPSGIDADFDTVNAGESRLLGGELELRGQPIPGLELFGSVGIAETEFLDFVDGEDDFSGNEFPNASPVTAAFGGSYAFENGIVLGADASFTAGAFGSAANLEETKSDGRFLVNAQVGYEQDTWGVYLYARNLLDNDYRTQVLSNGRSRTGEPLTVGAFARVQF
ncbi:MAG: TonB-dependent receptor [Pseudomonadota bacterium]